MGCSGPSGGAGNTLIETAYSLSLKIASCQLWRGNQQRGMKTTLKQQQSCKARTRISTGGADILYPKIGLESAVMLQWVMNLELRLSTTNNLDNRRAKQGETVARFRRKSSSQPRNLFNKISRVTRVLILRNTFVSGDCTVASCKERCGGVCLGTWGCYCPKKNV